MVLGWLHTDGRFIKNEAGQITRLQGAAISELEWGYPPMRATTIDELYYDWLKELGVTVIRLALNGSWLGQPVDSYLFFVDRIIDWCTARNIYVILDYHIGTVDADAWTNAAKLEVMQHPTEAVLGMPISWFDWCKFMAARYADNPTVCGIQIFNEPLYGAWVGLTQEELDAIWFPTALDCIRQIHIINPKLLCFVEPSAFENLARVTPKWFPFAEPNVVYCHVRYMMYDDPEAYYNSYLVGNYRLAKEQLETLFIVRGYTTNLYPVMELEWGAHQKPQPVFDPAKEPAFLQFCNDFLDIVRKYGNHQAYWTFSGGDINNGDLLMHDDWTKLSERGEIWHRYLVTPAPPIPLWKFAVIGLSIFGGAVAALKLTERRG